MMPAAKNGIHIICTAQIVMPMKPNNAKLTIIIVTMPATECGM